MAPLRQLASLVAPLPGEEREPTAQEVDGFFASDAMIRRLTRERLIAFSGIRALLMQACDPLAVVGFRRHSVIFDDPQTRLQRTDAAMSRIYFGTTEQAAETGAAIRAMHERVSGKTPAAYGPIPAGTSYAASDPELGLWVLATLADSALVYRERLFGSLTAAEREAAWQDYRRVGVLLGLPERSMPSSEPALRAYVRRRLGDGSLWISDEQRDLSLAIVFEPPFSGWLRAAMAPISETVKLTSVGLLPAEIRELLGLSWDPARETLLRSTLLQLRAGVRFWPETIRLHPAARAPAYEPYAPAA